VLQHRKLIRIVAEVVEEPGHQCRLDLGSCDARRSDNRAPQLIPAHPGHEIQTVVDRFRQTGKLSALAQEVGAHREHDVEPKIGVRCRGHEQLHKRRGLIDVLLLEAEELLELIDHDEHVVAGPHLRVAQQVDQA
jgi:hypothetical protein